LLADDYLRPSPFSKFTECHRRPRAQREHIYKAREVVRHGISENRKRFAGEMHERAFSYFEELLRQIKAFRAVSASA